MYIQSNSLFLKISVSVIVKFMIMFKAFKYVKTKLVLNWADIVFQINCLRNRNPFNLIRLGDLTDTFVGGESSEWGNQKF